MLDVDNAQQCFAFMPHAILPPIISIFIEGDELKSRLPFKIFSTLQGSKYSVSLILVNVIFDIFPLYFSTDSDDQSWFDYIWSGKFSSQQTNLEKDNAHILLAETLIYSIPQPPKSSVKIDHSYPAPESDIKVILPLISIFMS